MHSIYFLINDSLTIHLCQLHQLLPLVAVASFLKNKIKNIKKNKVIKKITFSLIILRTPPLAENI